MKTISLLHPFTAKAIGLKESDLYYYHSKPHENALRALQNEGYKVSIGYFTGKLLPYKKTISGIEKVFWTVTYPLFKNRHSWRKQQSYFHLIYNKYNVSDLTIFNMSGHGSKHIFKVAAQLLNQDKSYIAMIGGVHMSYDESTLNYYRNANHVIVHTEYQKKQLKLKSGFKDIDIRVIPLGTNTKMFLPLYKKPKENQLLYVGRISRLKQIEKTIDSLNYLVNVKNKVAYLKIIGPISDEIYFVELKKLVCSLNLKKYVSFLGSLKQEDLITYYQNANLLLLPSKHESFGMVMIEAMACGTPVVGLKGSGGPEEIIEHGVNGFLCDNENFNQNIFNIVTSKNIQSEINVNCRKIVEAKWSLEYTIDCFRNSVDSVFI